MPKKKKEKQVSSEETLWSLSDVARYLQVAERTVYVWAHKGQIPSFKLGNVWRFKKADIDVWIEDCREQSPRKQAD
tara:strand:+ start:271 stop:498 length:228 start_codon:yes stop_codon:yes gene_type:complete